MRDERIDIDQRPEITLQAPGLVERDEDGKWRLLPASEPRWLTVLARVGVGPVLCAFTRLKKRRTLPQNAFLWGPFYDALLQALRELYIDRPEACPWRTKEQIHEAMKHLFIGPTELELPPNLKGGIVRVEVPPTTTTLTTDQFNRFWRAIAEFWAVNYSIYLPEPNENWQPVVREIAA